MEDFWYEQIKDVQSFSFEGNSVPQHLISTFTVPVHFLIDRLRKGLATHLPALTLIRLCNAPAQSILIIFIAATHNNALQIIIEHNMHINYILQTCDTSRVECDTVLTDYKGYDVATGKMLVCVNPQWFRPTDVDNLWGDPTKAKTVLGWNPQKTSYEQLVEIMAKHDRERAKREKALKAVL